MLYWYNNKLRTKFKILIKNNSTYLPDTSAIVIEKACTFETMTFNAFSRCFWIVQKLEAFKGEGGGCLTKKSQNIT